MIPSLLDHRQRHPTSRALNEAEHPGAKAASRIPSAVQTGPAAVEQADPTTTWGTTPSPARHGHPKVLRLGLAAVLANETQEVA